MVFSLQWPDIHMPRKRRDSMGDYLGLGRPDEDWEAQIYGYDASDNPIMETKEQITKRMEGKHRSSSGEHIKMQAHKDAVDQKARMAEFEAAQQGARQSFVSHGKPFGMSRYKDTSMFPAKGTAKSDPARLQASPVGYDKEEWWRQSPYRSPVQENYSIFSMKPYSW
jgi:hypothetical protein